MKSCLGYSCVDYNRERAIEVTDRLHSHNAGFDHQLVKPADFGKVQGILATIPKKVI